MNTREALAAAIAALNYIPNTAIPSDNDERNSTYKLIPKLEAALKAETDALETIASMTLYGEPLYSESLIAEAKDVGEYDNEEGVYHPCSDAETNMLRDAVETARVALGWSDPLHVHHDAHGWYLVEHGEEEPEDGYSLGFDGRPHYATLE